MSVRSAQAIAVGFTTRRFDTGAATAADSLPTGKLYVNGVANGATVTIAATADSVTGSYFASVTLPALALNDVVYIRISATVNSVTDNGIIWTDTKDFFAASVPDVVAGGTGGLMIAGSNAATTFATLTVTGAVVFGSTFTVTTNLLVSGTTTLTGAVSLSSTLGITGATTFTGNVSMAAGLTVTQSTTNGNGVTFTGNGTGSGFVCTSGSGATGDGAQFTAASTNGNGISGLGTGTGNGVLGTGGNGTNGDGAHFVGGTGNSSGMRTLGGGTSGDGFTSIGTASGTHGASFIGAGVGNGLVTQGGGGGGNGFHAVGVSGSSGVLINGGATGTGITIAGGNTSGIGLSITTTSGDGVSILPTAGNAIVATANGTSKHGIVVTGGTAGTSDGVKAVAGTGGVDIRGNLTGNIHGTLDTLTTYTGDTPQTGDTFALANNGTSGFVAMNADVEELITTIGVAGAGLSAVPDLAGVTTLLTRLSSARGGYLDNLSAGAVALESESVLIYNRIGAPAGASIAADIAAATAPTAAQVATAVWQDATASDFTTAGSIGKSLGGAFASLGSSVYTAPALANAPSGTGASAATIATAVWQDLLSSGDLGTPGSIGALLKANIDAQVSLVPGATLDLANAIEGGITLRGAVRVMLSAIVGKNNGIGTGTEHYRDAGPSGDTKDRIVVVFDQAKNRIGVTLITS